MQATRSAPTTSDCIGIVGGLAGGAVSGSERMSATIDGGVADELIIQQQPGGSAGAGVIAAGDERSDRPATEVSSHHDSRDPSAAAQTAAARNIQRR
jgi:hypothetical protein